MSVIKRSLSAIAISIAELLIGILLLINPVGLSTAVIVIFGIVLMVLGLNYTVRYFFAEPEKAADGQLLAKGLIALLVGFYCAFRSHWFMVVFPVLTVLYGMVILCGGLIKLQWMMDILRMKRSRWIWAGIGAGVSIFCGGVILANPFRPAEALWMFIGISLMVEAFFDMMAAVFGNRDPRTLEKEVGQPCPD